ncbi:uroporphyrinogen-III synthase [Bosea sp. AAP35]|uniref:uroporphyrinogen-III synthase n=1 Tax=Bosea sp. AAP35 TaxID=1523417 RepID=UPI0006B901F9|nr:uroporphyrinogen-III synthase [Bosea sp. AAP35]
MRIFVFRPPAESERTAAAIRAHGHEPIVAPLFEILRLPEPAPDGSFSAIVLTSGNAVPALGELSVDRHDLPVFTVGDRTAAKAREAGFAAAHSAKGNRDDLVALIGDNLAAPARLLLIVGRDRHDDVGDRLAAAGFEIATWVAYEAQAVTSFPEAAREALREGGADGALHYSTRGVRTCLALAREAGVAEALLDLTHVTLSADVAGPLISAGASTVLVAEYPEEAALLAALDQVSARHRLSADVTKGGVASAGLETDKDAMNDPETPKDSAAPSSRPDSGTRRGGSSKGRAGRSGRTPPTIDATAHEVPQDVVTTDDTTPPVTDDQTTPDSASGPKIGPGVPPEAVLPTEALPQEFAGGPSDGSGQDASASPTEHLASTGPSGATPAAEQTRLATSTPSVGATRSDGVGSEPKPAPQPEPSRSRLPSLALAGLVGGLVGAGVVLFAMSRATPSVTPEQVAQLQSRLDALQTSTADLDRKATAASQAAAKANSAAEAATVRAGEIARAQAPDAGAIAGLSEQAKRAEAATSAIGQRLEQNSARIGTVESLAKAAAAPSPQALAAARVVLAQRVRVALESGQPFASDVAALAKGGGASQQVAALEAVAASGAPTKDALLAQLRTHRALFARELMPASAGWQERLMGLASRVVSIRPVGETRVDDAATLPIRLENAIVRGDNAAAAALWGQLPEPARRDSADFGEALRKRGEADAAISKIAQDAVAALGVAG